MAKTQRSRQLSGACDTGTLARLRHVAAGIVGYSGLLPVNAAARVRMFRYRGVCGWRC